MWDQLSAFLDYQAIRRHIESKLASPNVILGHISLFLVLTVIQFIYYSERPTYSYFGDPGAGMIMAGWSAVMLIHGLWLYRRSGAVYKNRSGVVDEEFRERLEADDTELLSNPKQVFRIRGMVDDDVRRRTVIFLPVFGFLVINAIMWVSWAIYYGARTPNAWAFTLPLAFFILLPTLVLHRRRSQQHDQQLAELLSGREPYKQKRMLAESDEPAYYLNDDGEIVDYPETEYSTDRRKAKE